MSRPKRTVELASLFFGLLLIMAVVVVALARRDDGFSVLPGRGSDNYTSNSDLNQAESELDASDLDSPTSDEQALESDLNF